jgi:hypothetical protein
MHLILAHLEHIWKRIRALLHGEQQQRHMDAGFAVMVVPVN